METAFRSPDTPRLMVDDRLEVKIVNSPFQFERSVDAELAARIDEAVNRMGGAGGSAEACYQQSLDALARRAKEVTRALAEELDRLDESSYLDRWALVQLMSELKHESALDPLDRLLVNRLPDERSSNPHSYTTAGEEVMIRTTAIEAITRIAADGSERGCELLLRHAAHENFSVRRAAIQGYLTCAGEGARDVLLKQLPERDHFILSIQRVDVRQVPQAQGGLHLANRREKDLPVHDLNPTRDCGSQGGTNGGDNGGTDGQDGCGCGSR